MGKRGRQRKGWPLLAEALAVVDKTGERFYEAELYRLKGELTLQQSQASKVSAVLDDPRRKPKRVFYKAIEIARKQQAKSLELRAAMSLAGCGSSKARRTKLTQLLAEIYNWFTEGFDTKDLQEAKALLEELT